MSLGLSSVERRRLCGLLGMLSSNHDGERAAAGYMAARMLQDRGLQWDDVLQPVQTSFCLPSPMRTDRPPTTSSSSYAPWINYLLSNSALLTDWERSLVISAATRDRLTEKQVAALSKTYRRVVARDSGS